MTGDVDKKEMYGPPREFSDKAYVGSVDQYRAMYGESVDDPEGFWGRMAEELVTWERRWDKVLDWEFETPRVEFFKGARLNVSYNCLDRHLESGKGDRIAIIRIPGRHDHAC